MSNFWARVLTLVIFFPLLFFLIFLLPFFHHVFFNAFVSLVALVGAFEIKGMFLKKEMPAMKAVAPLSAATLPAVAFAEEAALLPRGFFSFWIAALFGVFFVITVSVNREEKLRGRLPLFSSSVVVLMYPAFFLTFIVRITSLPHPQIALLFLLAPVFFNDIFAYLAGLIARGKTKLNLLVSPNKSLVGFISGFSASIGAVIACSLLLTQYYRMSVPAAIVFGALLALASFVGDLFESALKRSCGLKDSGAIIAGRGGILDAIDSLLLSAPLFLLLFPLIAFPSA